MDAGKTGRGGVLEGRLMSIYAPRVTMSKGSVQSNPILKVLLNCFFSFALLSPGKPINPQVKGAQGHKDIVQRGTCERAGVDILL